MFDLDNWSEIWTTITRNKFRSLLTGIGVSWGIFMLVGLLAIANGFRGGVNTLVDGFDKNSCFFSAATTSKPYKGYKKGRQWDLTNKDVTLIQRKASSVDEVLPGLLDYSTSKNVVRDNYSGSFSLRGIYSAQFTIEKQNILYGRLFNDLDVEYEKKVCVIGKEVYEALFAVDEDPVGQYIKVKGFQFKVVGVVSPVSQIVVGSNAEMTVFIPLSTMQRIFNKDNKVSFIACTPKPGYSAQMIEDEVTGLLQAAHNIAPDDEKAVKCFNAEAEFFIFQNLFEGVDILIWVVGLGSLLSGVIGVSNIMLVTVKERTREIGVRRALGASPVSIVQQIISESFVITTGFGMAGLVAGVFLLKFAQMEMAKHSFEDVLFLPPYITFGVAVAAFLVLCFAGVVAGLIPSIRALNIKAIDAIREE